MSGYLYRRQFQSAAEAPPGYIREEPFGYSRAARHQPGGPFLRGDENGMSAASRFQGMKADSTAEETLHCGLKFGRRGNPYLVGQFNNGFILTGVKKMQHDRARASVLKKGLAQLHQLVRRNFRFAHV